MPNPTKASINKALGINQPKRRRPPAIAVPTVDPKSLHNTVEQLKEAVETLQGQRGTDPMQAVPTWQDLIDLGVIAANQVPK